MSITTLAAAEAAVNSTGAAGINKETAIEILKSVWAPGLTVDVSWSAATHLAMTIAGPHAAISIEFKPTA